MRRLNEPGQARQRWGLAGAAGAMLFVVSGEVIPETHAEGRERSATFATILGFIAMMALAVLLRQ